MSGGMGRMSKGGAGDGTGKAVEEEKHNQKTLTPHPKPTHQSGRTGLDVVGNAAVLIERADGQRVNAVGVAIGIAVVARRAAVPRGPHVDGAQPTSSGVHALVQRTKGMAGRFWGQKRRQREARGKAAHWEVTLRGAYAVASGPGPSKRLPRSSGPQDEV